MKKVIGVAIIILGAIIGLWLGLYVLLYGGICQVINGLNPLQVNDVAVGIIRALLFELGFLPFWIGLICGITIMDM